MTIGTPLWDEFVANLKEVKVTVEDMGFMPDNFPCESELNNDRSAKGRYRASVY